MKIVYAFRRTTLYPQTGAGTDLPSGEARQRFLRKVQALGFEGLELGLPSGDPASLRELRQELEDMGLPCRALRGGGPSRHPQQESSNQARLEAALYAAAELGAPILNLTLGMPRPGPGGRGNFVGDPVSFGSSRQARSEDFERVAQALAAGAPLAAELGVHIAIEIHQHCLVDNSWSGLHLMELVDHPAVGLNPDLGNIYWNYDVPEETSEQAIVALAPHAKYWHCKNLVRVHIPENEHAIFLQVPLPDGEIDYRFALTAMRDAGYQGDLAIEGLRLGDQWWGDGRSVAYVKELLAE